ncbi:Endo-1,3-1,4-beta-glycanase ExsH [Bradyrhizobium ivorense]|uniref:Endo-1,3-1,4-beta-glycanase ExsH n=1 Tax=Bradyrhizobium ivorense TaxID=2511166 RepID=A0A508TM00_9BRAD|nr:calcium-binding protein [Bradyrhizobium ivorense]VIO75414.1 Endo-1,3-1,4-beta-glycanase ExsH [Bradyrhizobium ivorense]
MPFIQGTSSTQVSQITQISQGENDGSILSANNALARFQDGAIVQANGFIGDGPYGTTSGDFDYYVIAIPTNSTIQVDIDAYRLGSSLDPFLRLMDAAGNVVASSDDNDLNDSFFTYTNVNQPGNFYLQVAAFNNIQANAFDPSSGNGATSTGEYRLFIGEALQGSPLPIAYGTDNPETLNATAPNGSVLDGLQGDDTLNGLGGNDTFIWMGGNSIFGAVSDGNDTFNGAGGTDNADITGSNLGDHLYLRSVAGVAKLDISNSTYFNTLTFNSIESIDIHGRAGNDSLTVGDLTGTGVTGTVTYFADGDQNYLDAQLTTNNMRVFGGTGNDTYTTGAGNDHFYGSDGNDYYNGLGGTNEVDYSRYTRDLHIDLSNKGTQDTGAAGIDTLVNIQTLDGGSGFDTLIGDTNSNYLIGFGGNDTLIGGAGAANTLQGGTGDDHYIVQAAGDSVIEFANQGTDLVETALGSFTLSANVENLTHTGSADFTGVGNNLNNVMIGGTGNDYLVGAGGNDTLIDGSGLNTLQGGTGDDIYAVQSNADTVFEFANEGIDEVQTFLTSYTLSPNVEKLTFIGSPSHTGTGNVLNNTFTGASGDDTFTGAGGNDTYNYRTAGNGFDTINDFNADNANAAEHDHIDLTGRGLNFGSLALTSVTGGVVVGIPGGDAVLLKGVLIGQLDAGDFLF